ncbi:hypothetical protein V2G26_002932 [Clonostachys chloroleuca]
MQPKFSARLWTDEAGSHHWGVDLSQHRGRVHGTLHDPSLCRTTRLPRVTLAGLVLSEMRITSWSASNDGPLPLVGLRGIDCLPWYTAPVSHTAFASNSGFHVIINHKLCKTSRYYLN